MNRTLTPLLLSLALLPVTLLPAQDAASAGAPSSDTPHDWTVALGWPETHAQSWWHDDHVTGDLWGARSWLGAHGLTFDLVYTGEFFANLRGGMNTHDAREYRGDVSLFAELDTGRAGWWDGGRFFTHVQHEHGYGTSERHVGDFQVASNMEADDFTQLSEIWFRQDLLDGAFWLKLGKQEANTDFAFGDFRGEFIQSSAGFAPTIPLVTYPDPDWGAVVGAVPCEWFSINAGVYQGEPDGGRALSNTCDRLAGPMVMVEPALHYDVLGRHGHLRAGGWYNGARVDRLRANDPAPGMFGETYGWYLSWDQEVWSERHDDADDEQGIGVFGQYGWAPSDRSDAHIYAGGGVQWIGAIPTRDRDVVGIGVFHVTFSDEAGLSESGETATELFYKLWLAGFASLKLDVQYIADPGGAFPDAVVAGARLELWF